MNIITTLNEKLLEQDFSEEQDSSHLLSQYRVVANAYAKIENSVAVLSDLKSDKSYIYYGGLAEQLGLALKHTQKEIDSIWEEDIFAKIHPDDLAAKHMLEYQFLDLLKTVSIEDRANFYVSSRMHMLNAINEYISVHHRMFYLSSSPSGTLWFSLCLYNYSYTEDTVLPVSGNILNSMTGEVINLDRQKYENILSVREKEILKLIEKGKISKEIADQLSISKNTVDRHRQNILEKLRVKNSLEACRVAKLMGLL